MQTKESLKRITYECIEDCKNDGISYLEIRFAPILHTKKGLNIKEVIETVSDSIKVTQSSIGDITTGNNNNNNNKIYFVPKTSIPPNSILIPLVAITPSLILTI